MFNPTLLSGLDSKTNIVKFTYDTIMECKDEELRNQLWNNVILSGRNTMYTGLKDTYVTDKL